MLLLLQTQHFLLLREKRSTRETQLGFYCEAVTENAKYLSISADVIIYQKCVNDTTTAVSERGSVLYIGDTPAIPQQRNQQTPVISTVFCLVWNQLILTSSLRVCLAAV